jgi:hypothetical protein
MKPILMTNRTGKQFPSVDSHYHSPMLNGCSARCAKISAPAFRNISQDYFNTEARHHFLADAAVFGTMLVTAAVPIISGAFAIIELYRAFAF